MSITWRLLPVMKHIVGIGQSVAFRYGGALGVVGDTTFLVSLDEEKLPWELILVLLGEWERCISYLGCFFIFTCNDTLHVII